MPKSGLTAIQVGLV